MDSRDPLSLSLEQNLSTIVAKDVQIAETRDELNCCFLNKRTEFLLPGLPAEDNEENAAIIPPQLGGLCGILSLCVDWGRPQGSASVRQITM